MRTLVLAAVVLSLCSCATQRAGVPVKCPAGKCSLQECAFLKDAEPSPGENRSNVPIAVKDNVWYLQVPEGFQEAVLVNLVKEPTSISNACTGKKVNYMYNKETEVASIAKLPAEKTPTVLAVRWDDIKRWGEFDEFDKQDKNQFPAEDGTLFVGSSTIVGWKLDQYFPGLKATNRGFGGSQFVDAIHFAESVIVQYKPKTIVVYSGDNDMAEGQSPRHVQANVEALLRKIQFHLPCSRIFVLSVKPSFARWNIWPKMAEANVLIQETVKNHPNVTYVDIASVILGPDGQPRKDYYGPDGLHLSPAGYEAISAALRPLLAAQ